MPMAQLYHQPRPLCSRRTSSQGFRLDAEMNVDAKLLFRLFQDRHHDLWTVVDREHNVFDSCLLVR